MRKFLILFSFILAPYIATAASLKSIIPEAELRGEATFRYLGLPLYKARLFTKDGAALDWKNDFGLDLTYLRKLSRFDLVEGTMREFARTGSSLPVRGQLETCFADVNKGDRYLAVSQGPDRVGFWRNGTRTCTLSHPRITSRFMGIFLGENSRSKSFTQRLKGN